MEIHVGGIILGIIVGLFVYILGGPAWASYGFAVVVYLVKSE